ncbi:MAG: S41 family peptidase [Candidatus Aureabacteria bacterium]|nr:S41 family peptidase [Candidatus Auribacterota bacterium]
MTTRTLFRVFGGVAVACAVSFLSGSALLPARASDTQLRDSLDFFVSAMDLVQRNYYREVKASELTYGGFKGMCSALDPHSQFMDKAIYKEMKEETEGEFGGLGIEITMRDQFLTVVAAIEDTPAFKAGLQPGDRIVEIEGGSTKELSLVEAVRKLRGTPGTTVHITVMRPGKKEMLQFAITRANIQIQSIKDAGILMDKIGYVRITQFQEHTGRDFDKAMGELQKKGIQALVLDLRNNPGGLLQVAIEIADKFIGGDTLLVYTKGRVSSQNIEFRSHTKAAYPDIPVVVLVNKGSASGSEIVAGALQDLRRGVIVGSTSFGKGSVQSVLPLPDGSALRLTTAKYFTPKGRCIQKIGIAPDIAVTMSEEDEFKIQLKRRLEKMISESPRGTDVTAEKEEFKKLSRVRDLPLERATDLLQGLRAYTRVSHNGQKIQAQASTAGSSKTGVKDASTSAH